MTAALTTAERAVLIRQRNPCMTLLGIGQAIGVTPERVRQVLVEAGEPTRHLNPWPVYECSQCRGAFQATNHQRARIKTGAAPPQFCSLVCSKAAHQVPLICDYCGKPFLRQQTRVLVQARDRRYKGSVFCGRACWLAKAGRQFGAGDEETRQKRIATRKRISAARTHCAQGHPRIPENVRLDTRPNGYAHTICRVCNREQQRASYRVRQRLALAH